MKSYYVLSKKEESKGRIIRLSLLNNDLDRNNNFVSIDHFIPIVNVSEFCLKVGVNTSMIKPDNIMNSKSNIEMELMGLLCFNGNKNRAVAFYPCIEKNISNYYKNFLNQ